MWLRSRVQELLRHPRALAAVVGLSLAVGLLASFRVGPSGVESRRAEVGYARAAAVVDSQPSQAVDAGAGGGWIAALTDRAVLLADLATRSPLREEIADRAGVPRDRLIVQRPMNLLEKRLTHPEVTHTSVEAGNRQATILHVAVNPLVEGKSPIVGVDVRAPDARSAARVADQALAVLRDHVAAAPGARRPMAVRQLEPATAGTTVTGPSRTLALLAALAVLGLGCAATIGVARAGTALRRRRLAM
jgi:hypothetical protein